MSVCFKILLGLLAVFFIWLVFGAIQKGVFTLGYNKVIITVDRNKSPFFFWFMVLITCVTCFMVLSLLYLFLLPLLS